MCERKELFIAHSFGLESMHICVYVYLCFVFIINYMYLAGTAKISVECILA